MSRGWALCAVLCLALMARAGINNPPIGGGASITNVPGWLGTQQTLLAGEANTNLTVNVTHGATALLVATNVLTSNVTVSLTLPNLGTNLLALMLNVPCLSSSQESYQTNTVPGTNTITLTAGGYINGNSQTGAGLYTWSESGYYYHESYSFYIQYWPASNAWILSDSSGEQVIPYVASTDGDIFTFTNLVASSESYLPLPGVSFGAGGEVITTNVVSASYNLVWPTNCVSVGGSAPAISNSVSIVTNRFDMVWDAVLQKYVIGPPKFDLQQVVNP